MLLPRKWALSLGLLAAAPTISVAGPFERPVQQVTQNAERDNQAVAQDIAKALGKARLTHKDVKIEYRAGTATIGGFIKDESQRATVTKICSQVAGVQTVENDLQLMTARPAEENPFSQDNRVTPASHTGSPAQQVQRVNHQAGPSNQQVAQGIADSLTQAGLSGYDVEIRYKNGIASLLGSVENPQQVQAAQRATEGVPGVQQVLNKLTVNGQQVNVQPAGGTRPQMQAPPAQFRGPQGAPVQQMQGYAPGPQGQMGPPQGQMGPGAMGPGAMGPGAMPPGYGHAQPANHQIYNQPQMPEHAWPSYAQYDNYAAVTYPGQYDASAFPYIGPYYPYPQVPMGWRSSTLEWDDGAWNLKFESRTDKWWWFLHPKNWD